MRHQKAARQHKGQCDHVEGEALHGQAGCHPSTGVLQVQDRYAGGHQRADVSAQRCHAGRSPFEPNDCIGGKDGLVAVLRHYAGRDQRPRGEQKLFCCADYPNDVQADERSPRSAGGVWLVGSIGLDLQDLAQVDVVLGGYLFVDHHLVVRPGIEHPPFEHNGFVDSGEPPVPVGGEQQAARLAVNRAEEQVPDC